VIELLSAVLLGLLAGALANWAAEALPERRGQLSAGRATLGAVAQAQRGVLHYLTLPWYFFRRPGGVCPHCGQRRPMRSPLLELAMIAAFVLIAWGTGGQPVRTLLLWLYAWFLLTVLVIDLERRLVLNVMTAPAAVLALAASFLPGAPTPVEALIGGAVGFGLFFLIALIGRGAMGMGDVKLAGVIGLMLGWPAALTALLAGIILGGLAAAILLITRRATRKTAIAYAPYLCLGALAILLLMG
jgi:prepilin signal peptidase PulO-like enzyme (type II secretory pathway)